MNVIIVGCGRVGQTLAEKLNVDGNNVVVIDTSAAKVNEITAKYDVMGVVGKRDTQRFARGGHCLGRAVYCRYQLGRVELALLYDCKTRGRLSNDCAFEKPRIQG